MAVFNRMFFRLLMPFGIGYVMSALLGSAMAIMSPKLVAEFGLSPTDLGFMGSVFLISFAITQIPLGVFLDRYGGRRTLPPLMLCASVGTFVMFVATDYSQLLISRILVGIGFAGSLMTSFKVYAEWLRREDLPIAYSLTSLFGGIGGIIATRPLAALIDIYPWRHVILAFGVITAIVAAAIWLLIPEKRVVSAKTETETIFVQVRQMAFFLFDGRFWAVGSIVIVAQSLLFVYMYLWLAPWFADVALFNESTTARYMMYASIGTALGYFLNGFVADFVVRKRIMTVEQLYLGIGALTALLLTAIVLLNNAGAALLWPPIQFLATMTMISFPLMRNRFDDGEIGRVLTLLNFMVFLAGFVLQWLCGVILELYPIADGGYSPAGFRAGLALLAALSVAAFIYCKIKLKK